MIKKFSLVSALVLGCFVASPSFAQATKPIPTVLNGGTNNVAAATTNAYTGITLGVQDYTDVSLQVTYAGDSGCTGNSTLLISQSADGTTYETTPSFSLALTNVGVTSQTYFTNLHVPGTYNLKIVSWGNTNAAHYNTNINVKWYPKVPRYNNHN